MHYALKCQEQGLPVSQAIERYCAQLHADEIFISDEDRAHIAQELLEHFNIVQTYLQRVYKTWMAAGSIPEQYRALTRAANCDTASVLDIINTIRQDLIDCCNQYGIDFAGTWTALTELQTDISTCCSTQQANFVSTWTIINSLSSTSSLCGPVTVIRQSDMPYIISTPGNYCLAEDIVFSGNSGAITIQASNVFLDMHNHEILCNNINANTIQILAHDIFINNGTFTGGGQGIIISGPNSSNITIEKCLFQNQVSTGIAITNPSNPTHHTIAHCIFRNMTASAINYQASGDTITIHDCTICNCDAGLFINSSSNITIQYCIVYQLNLGGGGIVLSDTINTLVQHCIVCAAENNGIELDGGMLNSQQNNVASCLVSNNGAAGIYLRSILHGTITDCYLYQNSVGIDIQNSFYSVIDRCITAQNGTGIALSDVNSSGNHIIQNTLSVSNFFSGIQYGNLTNLYNCTLLNNRNFSIVCPGSATPTKLSVENCMFNTPLSLTNTPRNTNNSIVRNNEAFSCAGTAFANTVTSNFFYNNNAFNAGSPSYNGVDNVLNVDNPDSLSGTVGDILSNLTNTN